MTAVRAPFEPRRAHDVHQPCTVVAMAADLATSIHSFTGRSAVLDEMMRVLADYVI